MAILTGILLGLGTLLFIGPVFFYLLKSSLESGFKAGFAVVLGIIIGDIICVFLSFYGGQSFFENPDNQKWIALSGGIVLLLMGIKFLLQKESAPAVEGKFKAQTFGVYFINGFIINFVNPFVFIVWFGFIALCKSKYESTELVISIVVILATIFVTDLLKVHFANKLVGISKPKVLKIIFKIIGILMIIFGGRLIFEFFRLFN